jgi:nucleotide-binding universal stress UspA family protein
VTELSPERILVPTDFSEPAAEALEVAIGFAVRFGARLTLLHAHEMPTYAFPDAVMPVTPQVVAELERTAKVELERLAERARSRGVTTETIAVVGPNHLEVCRIAEEMGADLIVMGTHGRTGIRHAILGSVAEKVVRRAPCPVLTVRPHATEPHHPHPHP